ncbi:MAG: hypothetical protein KDD69_00620 [Bdellovibrionales bacterium]|nr:hypothetical protein [Bdellovibrionales bacterium]
MKSEVTTTRGRPFSGVVGLKTGYDETGRIFERSELLTSYEKWLRLRHQSGESFIGAVFGVVIGKASYPPSCKGS